MCVCVYIYIYMFAYFKVSEESILHQLNILELLCSPSLPPFHLKRAYSISSPIFSMTFDKNSTCLVEFCVNSKPLVMLPVPPSFPSLLKIYSMKENFNFSIS